MSHLNGRDKRVRSLHKRLGEFDAVCSYVAVAASSFEEQLAAEPNRKLALAKKSADVGVVLHHTDKKKAENWISSSLLVGIYSLFDVFLKEEVKKHPSFQRSQSTQENTLDTVDKAYSCPPCDKVYVDIVKYYRWVRHELVHDKKKPSECKRLRSSIHKSMPNFSGGAPNQIGELNYWDTNLYTRAVKIYAEAICKLVKLPNDEIAALVANNLGNLKRLDKSSGRFRSAVAGRIQQQFGVDRSDCQEILNMICGC